MRVPRLTPLRAPGAPSVADLSPRQPSKPVQAPRPLPGQPDQLTGPPQLMCSQGWPNPSWATRPGACRVSPSPVHTSRPGTSNRAPPAGPPTAEPDTTGPRSIRPGDGGVSLRFASDGRILLRAPAEVT